MSHSCHDILESPFQGTVAVPAPSKACYKARIPGYSSGPLVQNLHLMDIPGDKQAVAKSEEPDVDSEDLTWVMAHHKKEGREERVQGAGVWGAKNTTCSISFAQGCQWDHLI